MDTEIKNYFEGDFFYENFLMPASIDVCLGH